MNVNGKERLIAYTKPGRERMYLTHEAKGHEIPVALGNTVATGGSNSTGATNSNRLGKPARYKLDGNRGQRKWCGGSPTYGACRAPRRSSTRTWGPSC